MSLKLKSVRGMNDKLPTQTAVWQYLEDLLRQLSSNYGYSEIRTPIVESTDLFKRSIGEVTDIVEKEMYTFADRNGDSLTLRPEGTASCVRMGLEHGLFHNQLQRLWYIGPMFRHERPQKGRYRQFHQFGLEAFGMAEASIDAEIILFSARLWQRLGLAGEVELQINSLGSQAARTAYRGLLVDYFLAHQSELDEDSLRRLETNPMRILDSKNPEMQMLIANAPMLQDHLDDASEQHFAELRQYLDAAQIGYTINPRLVRGLDYYNRTVFEWVTTRLGAQGTVCAGGRYDGLVEQLGGKETPAVGLAIGLERILELIETTSQQLATSAVDIYILSTGETAQSVALQLAEQLRDAFQQQKIVVDCANGSIKSQFKRADKSGAQLAIVIADDELATDQVSVKTFTR